MLKLEILVYNLGKKCGSREICINFKEKTKVGKNKLFLLIFIILLIILFGIYVVAACDMLGINFAAETSSSEAAKNKEETNLEQDTEETVVEFTEEETTTTTIPQEQQTIETSADTSTVITAGITNQTARRIALTFDAGWEYENTEELLNLLDEYNLKATFFSRGLWV